MCNNCSVAVKLTWTFLFSRASLQSSVFLCLYFHVYLLVMALCHSPCESTAPFRFSSLRFIYGNLTALNPQLRLILSDRLRPSCPTGPPSSASRHTIPRTHTDGLLVGTILHSGGPNTGSRWLQGTGVWSGLGCRVSTANKPQRRQEPFLLLVPAERQPGPTKFDPRFGQSLDDLVMML